METIFINTKNSKTNDSNKFIYQFTNNRNLKNLSNKNIGLVNLSIYYTWKNIKSAYNNNKFKISAPTWNDTFDLPDGSYSISDIQDYFEFIIKKHETLAENPPIQIYPNKIKNRIVFKVKTGYKLELLSPEMMKLLGSTKQDVDKDKDGGVPKLESVEVVSVHCNLTNNSYQQASKVLFTFAPNKQFGQLITISHHSLTMLKTTNAEFQSVELWFTDQDNRLLQIEDSVNITLILGRDYKTEILNRRKFKKYVTGFSFLSFKRKFGDKYVKKLMDTATKT